MKIKNILYGVGYSVVGTLGGLIAGGFSSIVFLIARMNLHLPTSLPKVDVTIDASKLNVPELMNCIQAQRPNCTVPLDFTTNAGSWAEPLVYGPAIGASLGLLSGFALCAAKLYKSNQDSERDTESLNSNTSRQWLVTS